MKMIKTVFNYLVGLITDPKRILNLLVLITCMCVSMYQLMGCIDKLRHPPISTHFRSVVNETLNYPAVTICRNPPYKLNILQKFNLGNQNSEIYHTSEWEKFPFSSASMQQLWDKASYSQAEVLKLYGLHGLPENVEVRKAYYLLYGQCFTLIPRVGSSLPWPNSGWSIMMSLGKEEYNDGLSNTNKTALKIGLATEVQKSGFHVFIHEVREPWSENNLQTHYTMQYLYLEVEEEIELKINAEEYTRLLTEKQQCVQDINYSQCECIEYNRWLNISKEVGCTGPWMRGIGLPHCNSYAKVKKLISDYSIFDDKNEWGCHSACNMTAYKLFVVKRTPIIRPFSQLYIYYSSKMVSVMEERPGYDMNNFLADLGGSLGFFLGLSVIGMIGLIEKFLRSIFCHVTPTVYEDEKNTPLPELEKY